jgi:hypothetical protein
MTFPNLFDRKYDIAVEEASIKKLAIITFDSQNDQYYSLQTATLEMKQEPAYQVFKVFLSKGKISTYLP